MIYLDHSATSPLYPEAFERMLPFLKKSFANPSSFYRSARNNRVKLRKFRAIFAEIINAEPEEIFFTCGGTESNNTAIESVCLFARKHFGKNHLIIGGAEHSSVYHSALKLKEFCGFELTVLSLNKYGEISSEELKNFLREETALVSVIFGNNEIGTLQDVAAIGAMLRERKVLFHTDAVQTFAWRDWDLKKFPADFVSFSAHKFGGPKGVGILYKKSSVDFVSHLSGGSQENRLRAGTENLAGIAGTICAAEISIAQKSRREQIGELTRNLIKRTLAISPQIKLTGNPEKRLPFHASFIVPGIHSEILMMEADLAEICISSGSACTVGNSEPSRILLNTGIGKKDAVCAIRVTLGLGSQDKDVGGFIRVLQKICRAEDIP